MLTESQIERYARHILLREVGGFGQERILGASVSMEGLGEVGCWAATYLALAGVGRLRLADPRRVPPGGILPMLPAHESASRRDEALAAAIPAFNPDVAAEVVGLAGAGFAELGVMVASVDGHPTGQGLFSVAIGEVAVVGWANGWPCASCLGLPGDDSGQPGGARPIDPCPPSPESAALAGSLAASMLLAALLDPGAPRRGLVAFEAGETRPIPGCSHQTPWCQTLSAAADEPGSGSDGPTPRS